jgi:outer membrane protein assembly factor BamB
MAADGWTHEDGGPRRTQVVPGALGTGPGALLEVTTRIAPVTTMAVRGAAEGDLLLLRHTPGEPSSAVVERCDPKSLEPLAASPELPAGPVWPGGLGATDDGGAHVVFGAHAHRLDAELRLVASRALPRARPYNSFVVLDDGHLVTKDFAGSTPARAVPARDREPSELVVLDPATLEIVDRLVLPEPSIARLSADGSDVYVVGDSSLLVVSWDGRRLALQPDRTIRYRTQEGQGYGWDCVLVGGCAWFLDDGEGTEAYAGTLRGKGVATAPLHLVRCDLRTGEVALAEVCGRPGGVVANPPVVDAARGIAVGYDSGNGVLAGFDLASLELRWRREQDHGSHLLLFAGSGELVTGDHADLVVLDVETGAERARADTGSGMQSVLFPAPGWDHDVYLCSFLTLSRIAVVSA